MMRYIKQKRHIRHSAIAAASAALLIAVFVAPLSAQEPKAEPGAEAPKLSRAPFMGPMLIHMPSTKIIEKKTMDFYINHRFGNANQGLEDFFGLDNGATMQLSVDYGITNSWSVGVARNSTDKTWEYRTKYMAFEQSKTLPFSLGVFAAAGQKSSELFADLGPYMLSPPLTGNQYIDYEIQKINYDRYRLTNSDKRSFLLSFLISHRFNRNFSLQISPMYVHKNWVKSQSPNDNTGVSVGGRIKLSKRVDIVFETIFSKHRDYVGSSYETADRTSYTYDTPMGTVYTQTLTGDQINAQYPLNNRQNIAYVYLQNVYFDQDVPHLFVPASIGIDIDTGGHVFNIFASNSTATAHTALLDGANYDWTKNDFVVGFNIHRVFWFDERSKLQ